MSFKEHKTTKKYKSNALLALTELWLHKEATNGWILTDIKDSLLWNTYSFVKSKPSDDVYISYANFCKQPKYESTNLSILSYIKNKYHGKYLKSHLWVKLHKSKITDINDFKTNMLIREKHIKIQYIQWLIAFTILLILSCYLTIFEQSMWYAVIFSLIGSIILVAKLYIHKINCKTVYNKYFNT